MVEQRDLITRNEHAAALTAFLKLNIIYLTFN